MNAHDAAGRPRPAREDRIKLVGSLALSLFFVAFLWNFFLRGTYALGLNAAVWFGGMLALFLWALRREGISLRANLGWIAPTGLIVLSYALYDNPFVKGASLLALPGTFVLFYNDAMLSAHGRQRWSAKVVEALVRRALSLLTHVRKAAGLVEGVASGARERSGTLKRVVAGTLLFLLVAVAVVIPLLSSADPQFALYTSFIGDWFYRLFSTDLFAKILLAFLMTVATASALLAWARPFAPPSEADEPRRVDPIVAGIVLGGVLAIYVLFLWIQLGHLWIGGLPVGFSETERLVKGGFWQLFCLTSINILFAFALYRKTVPALQRLLLAFAVASILLLASAAWRMGLYAVFYGLSYEKFFASYTVVYCAALLLWLCVRLAMPGRADIVRVPALLFLWMFAVVAVLPVERIILTSNVALAQREGSRIRLFELTMLSPDVLNLIRTYQDQGKLKDSPALYPPREPSASQAETPPVGFAWDPWIESRERIVADKAWYEWTLSNLLNRR